MPPATTDKTTARFRPASDFPRSITGLKQEKAEAIYLELRDCLIFTNRSRGQLTRRNQEYKNKAMQLQSDVQRLQSLIEKLEVDKLQIEASKRQVISELQAEFATVSQHLDELSSAFDEIQDFENLLKSPTGLISATPRLIKFLRRIVTIVRFWRRPDDSQPTLTGTEQDRRDRPQMYDDPESNGRSLLDR
ncbi:hypothetical protein [Synechococcus elongatus]|uniref:Uncharacterized protein n=2 Tax=Synechococcus elongatus TaxID=32046 RepID=Q31NN5_SYNE7|nr:hypothetical protein [Synechococcus elongatus]ABB57334.1 conserved hypothetical protein [Synechococcus elongatus PCC 7942 = FACHB-805]AJD58155.1 hypothetical protein M744_10105 [Synechococcus elongatus UTEX 2973]MBD2587741.1 hypothetical protein [Synechococcus elongatus FACHB-242]MBD2688480.1 hypothetical protein [Synechococcus elongatus FACHB-1061]MBD2707551.1 hypothetical protein [Synechococcus elongatus PCC 7942 = FACHB-805]